MCRNSQIERPSPKDVKSDAQHIGHVSCATVLSTQPYRKNTTL